MLRSRIEFDPAPSAGSREIISPSAGRVSLTFFPPSTGSVTLSTEDIAADGNGIFLAAGMPPLYLHLWMHGEVVQQQWKAKYSVGATGVSWIQGLK